MSGNKMSSEDDNDFAILLEGRKFCRRTCIKKIPYQSFEEATLKATLHNFYCNNHQLLFDRCDLLLICKATHVQKLRYLRSSNTIIVI